MTDPSRLLTSVLSPPQQPQGFNFVARVEAGDASLFARATSAVGNLQLWDELHANGRARKTGPRQSMRKGFTKLDRNYSAMQEVIDRAQKKREQATAAGTAAVAAVQEGGVVTYKHARTNPLHLSRKQVRLSQYHTAIMAITKSSTSFALEVAFCCMGFRFFFFSFLTV